MWGLYKRKEALMRPTPIYSLSTELGANTIDPDKLNCRVRNGNGCDLIGINIDLIKASYFKRTNRERISYFSTPPFPLESCSALTRRLIASLPTSDNLEKHKFLTYLFSSIGLKNTAKPHDLLVKIS